jgi:hypothetical protein
MDEAAGLPVVSSIELIARIDPTANQAGGEVRVD